MKPRRSFRGLLVALALAGLLGMYVFQQVPWELLLGVADPMWGFVLNRTIRFFVNDSLVVLLVYALFRQRSYTRFAWAVQMAGFIFILVPYLIIKFHYPAYNGPMISFLHRLIVNPLLMLLLIPAFYYQQQKR